MNNKPSLAFRVGRTVYTGYPNDTPWLAGRGIRATSRARLLLGRWQGKRPVRLFFGAVLHRGREIRYKFPLNGLHEQPYLYWSKLHPDLALASLRKAGAALCAFGNLSNQSAISAAGRVN